MGVPEIIVRSVNDILQAIEDFEAETRSQTWFRGHRDPTWALIPAVHREYSPSRELGLTNSFRMRAPAIRQDVPNPDNFARWLCIMQHHGLPTRLLDWSESPTTAAFFATSWQQPESDAILWMLSPVRLNELDGHGPGIYQLAAVESLLAPAFRKGAEGDNHCIAALAEHVDRRMAAQLAAFTLHGSTGPLEGREGADRCLRRLVIPSESIPKLRVQLHHLGVRTSLLFPDLSGLADELAQHFKNITLLEDD